MREKIVHYSFPSQFKTGTCTELSLHCDTGIYGSDHNDFFFLKFVLKQLLILQYNDCDTEFFIEFFLLIITCRKLMLFHMMSVLFCKENVEIIQHVFMVCSEILPLYGIILVCIFIGKKNKNIELALMLMMYYLMKCHSCSGCNKFVNL